MRAFLLNNLPVFLWAMAGFQLAMLILFVTKYMRHKKSLYLLAGLVTVGLFYDALMLSLGSMVNDSQCFAAFSRMRFVSHGMLIPLLFPICAEALDFRKKGKTVVWVITAAFMAGGLAESIATVLGVSEIGGVLRYAATDATPAWASTFSLGISIGAVIPVMIAGIAVWIKQKTPTLFLAGFLMFMASAGGVAVGKDLMFAVSMIGEALMALFFYLYANHKTKHSL